MALDPVLLEGSLEDLVDAEGFLAGANLAVVRKTLEPVAKSGSRIPSRFAWIPPNANPRPDAFHCIYVQ